MTYCLRTLAAQDHLEAKVRREDYARAGIVDAGLILKELFGIERAEKFLLNAGISPEIVARVFQCDPGVRRSQSSIPASMR